MSVTIATPVVYDKWINEGTMICIMCGQHNKANSNYCWYCQSSHVIPMEEAGCIRRDARVPAELGSMILDHYGEVEERVASYKGYTTKVLKDMGIEKSSCIRELGGIRTILRWESYDSFLEDKWNVRVFGEFAKKFEGRNKQMFTEELYDIKSRARTSLTTLRMNGDEFLMVQILGDAS